MQGIKDPFMLAGDTTLDESPDTLKAAQQAVATSKWQIDQVDPKAPAPAALKLAPDVSGPSVVVFANVMIENMDALIAKLQEKVRLRPIPPAPAPAHPAPAR